MVYSIVSFSQVSSFCIPKSSQKDLQLSLLIQATSACTKLSNDRCSTSAQHRPKRDSRAATALTFQSVTFCSAFYCKDGWCKVPILEVHGSLKTSSDQQVQRICSQKFLQLFVSWQHALRLQPQVEAENPRLPT